MLRSRHAAFATAHPLLVCPHGLPRDLFSLFQSLPQGKRRLVGYSARLDLGYRAACEHHHAAAVGTARRPHRRQEPHRGVPVRRLCARIFVARRRERLCRDCARHFGSGIFWRRRPAHRYFREPRELARRRPPCVWFRSGVGHRRVFFLGAHFPLDSCPLPVGLWNGTESRRSFRTRIGDHVRRYRRPRVRSGAPGPFPATRRSGFVASGAGRLEIAIEQQRVHSISLFFVRRLSFVEWAHVAFPDLRACPRWGYRDDSQHVALHARRRNSADPGIGQRTQTMGARGLLGVGVFVGGLRWILCAIITDLRLLAVVQTLHGVTVVGLLMGGPLYLDIIAPEKLRSTAQAVLSMVGVGIAGIMSNLGSGWLLEHAGVDILYIVTGIGSAALGVLVCWILPLPERSRDNPPLMDHVRID